MSAVSNSIAIKIGADTSSLERGMKKAGKSVKKFGDDGEAMSKRFAKVAAKVTASVAVMGIAVGKMGLDTARTAKEIQNLSNVAGVSAEKFQVLRFAARDFGVGQEKLADILKDVNDKFGDFFQTGAGPLADFFENIAPKVGVTADQFKRLSGPDALQLYVTSLEKANVSQSELTFYMEALASDATALAPLFMNAGAALDQMRIYAEDLGVVLDEDLIRGAAQMDDVWSRVMASMTSNFQKFSAITLRGLDAIFNLTDSEQLKDLNAKGDTAYKSHMQLLENMKGVDSDPRFQGGGAVSANQAAILREKIKAPMREQLAILVDERNAINEEIRSVGERVEKLRAAREMMENLRNGDGFGTADLPEGGGGGRGGSGRRGGGGAGPSEVDLDRLREGLATQAEILANDYAQQLAALEEFRNSKQISEQEFNDMEARARKTHTDKLAAIDRQSMAVKMQAVSGVLSAVSGLMMSGNKKQFEMGKKMAMASAGIDGARAAVSAWRSGMETAGPYAPFMAAAYAAASLAKTGAMISNIGSQSFGGGGGHRGGGGGGFGGGRRSAPAAPTSNRIATNVQINGDVFGRDQVIGLINAINEAQEDGAILRFV